MHRLIVPDLRKRQRASRQAIRLFRADQRNCCNEAAAIHAAERQNAPCPDSDRAKKAHGIHGLTCIAAFAYGNFSALCALQEKLPQTALPLSAAIRSRPARSWSHPLSLTSPSARSS